MAAGPSARFVQGLLSRVLEEEAGAMERWLVTPESGAVRDRPSEKGSSSYRPSEMGLRRRRQRQDSSVTSCLGGGTVKRDDVRVDFIQVYVYRAGFSSGRCVLLHVLEPTAVWPTVFAIFLPLFFWRHFLNI
jgi:hypothetical protein